MLLLIIIFIVVALCTKFLLFSRTEEQIMTETKESVKPEALPVIKNKLVVPALKKKKKSGPLKTKSKKK